MGDLSRSSKIEGMIVKHSASVKAALLDGAYHSLVRKKYLPTSLISTEMFREESDDS